MGSMMRPLTIKESVQKGGGQALTALLRRSGTEALVTLFATHALSGEI